VRAPEIPETDACQPPQTSTKSRDRFGVRGLASVLDELERRMPWRRATGTRTDDCDMGLEEVGLLGWGSFASCGGCPTSIRCLQTGAGSMCVPFVPKTKMNMGFTDSPAYLTRYVHPS
jgi:hypothetical protein